MKDLWWLLMGLLHISVHPDSSFITLLQLEINSLSVVLLVVLFSSFWLVLLRWLNKKGLTFVLRRRVKLVTKIHRISSGMIGKFGYLGLVALCLIPGFPCLKEASLLSGQILGLKYTLSIVLVFNGLRIVTLSSFFC